MTYVVYFNNRTGMMEIGETRQGETGIQFVNRVGGVHFSNHESLVDAKKALQFEIDSPGDFIDKGEKLRS